MHRLPAIFCPARQARSAAHQFPASVGGSGGIAQIALPGKALLALAAGRQEYQHHAVAHGKARLVRIAQCKHRSGGLVPQRHRHRAWAVSVDDGEIGMADACRIDPQQDFAGFGIGEIERGNRERFVLRIRARVFAAAVKHGGGDAARGVGGGHVCSNRHFDCEGAGAQVFSNSQTSSKPINEQNSLKLKMPSGSPIPLSLRSRRDFSMAVAATRLVSEG